MLVELILTLVQERTLKRVHLDCIVVAFNLTGENLGRELLTTFLGLVNREANHIEFSIGWSFHYLHKVATFDQETMKSEFHITTLNSLHISLSIDCHINAFLFRVKRTNNFSIRSVDIITPAIRGTGSFIVGVFGTGLSHRIFIRLDSFDEVSLLYLLRETVTQ